MDEARNGAAQIEQRVQPDRCLGGAEQRPRKYRQAQVDGRGIQDIDRVGQVHAEGLAGIELSCRHDQTFAELGIDAPVAFLVGIGQRGTADGGAQTHVVELGRLRLETGLDVAQALPIGQRGKGYAAVLFGAAQGSDRTR